ncbi:MAG: hypothetical protein LIP28_10320 [Deltaproteobacteria bacterium]|nr:hypothetical protein [Deltaproteobacteria bacterium]
MNSAEFYLGNAVVASSGESFAVREYLQNRQPVIGYDLDLIYVECRLCGKPVLWEKGKTSLLLHASGIDVSLLDSECMILSEGCPQCRPGASPFHLNVVRVTSITPQDVLLLSENKGRA